MVKAAPWIETLEALSRRRSQGLQHRSAGKGSNRPKPEKFRREALKLIREKYSGTAQERFAPTLVTENYAVHLLENYSLYPIGSHSG